MPSSSTSLAAMGDADLAFLAFDKFLSGLPAGGVHLTSLLKANPRLLDLLATILGSAPRLAGLMSRRPKVLDAVLELQLLRPHAHGSRDGAGDLLRHAGAGAGRGGGPGASSARSRPSGSACACSPRR